MQDSIEISIKKYYDVHAQRMSNLGIGYQVDYKINSFPRYVLSEDKVFTLYELSYVVYEDREQWESNDAIGFWAYTDNPLKELKNRLIKFEKVMFKTIKQLDQKTNIYGLTVKYLPTDPTESFFNELLIAWVKSVRPELLDIPKDYIQAKDHIVALEYKFRKMVELYNSVRDSEYLRDFFNLYDK